jgi:hypothetical protein
MKKLDIAEIFKSDAEIILKSRSDAVRLHPTDIRAAGNQVEGTVRNYFRRMLPPKYYVTHGHLIDINGEVSSQLDLIIADNANLPSLMTTQDGTEYIPIDSVYAFGEIKSTYYKSKDPLQGLSKQIEDIRTRLFHEEIENSAYQSIRTGKIDLNAALDHLVLGKGNRFFNRIFAFALFTDAGDFAFEDVAEFFVRREQQFLPNVTILLNKGVILWGSLTESGINYIRDPQEMNTGSEDWLFGPQSGAGCGSLEGNHLGFLYYMLVEHLNHSYLEPPALNKYLQSMLIGRKSLMQKAQNFHSS